MSDVTNQFTDDSVARVVLLKATIWALLRTPSLYAPPVMMSKVLPPVKFPIAMEFNVVLVSTNQFFSLKTVGAAGVPFQSIS